MENSIVRSIELKAPVSRVWEALTDHLQFGEWFLVSIDGPFRVGQVSTGRVTYPGYEHLPWHVVIEAMDAVSYFAYRWYPCTWGADPDYSKEPTTLVEFRLEPTQTGTRLRVAESGFSDLPSDCNPQEAFRNNTRGWEEQVRNIEAYLDA